MKKLIFTVLIALTSGCSTTSQFINYDSEVYSGVVYKTFTTSGTVAEDRTESAGLIGNLAGGLAGFSSVGGYAGIAIGALIGQMSAYKIDEAISVKPYQQVFIKSADGREFIYIDTTMTEYKIGQSITVYKPLSLER